MCQVCASSGRSGRRRWRSSYIPRRLSARKDIPAGRAYRSRSREIQKHGAVEMEARQHDLRKIDGYQKPAREPHSANHRPNVTGSAKQTHTNVRSPFQKRKDAKTVLSPTSLPVRMVLRVPSHVAASTMAFENSANARPTVETSYPRLAFS